MAQAVALGGLTPPNPLDTVGEPETLHQRWEMWKNELEIYITASGVVNAAQKRAVLLLTGGEGLREIWKNFTEEQKAHRPANDQHAAQDVFQIAIQLFDNTFALRENIPKSRTKFWETEPNAGETINNFITRLKVLVKTCNFGAEADNHVRDKVLLHIKNSELKAKLYREDNLTLDRLIQVIGLYHHKEALILSSPSTTNHVSGRAKPKPKHKAPPQSGCYKCGAQGHIGRECIRSKNHKCSHCGKKGHFDEFCFHKNKSKSNQDDTQSSQGRSKASGRSRDDPKQSKGRNKKGQHRVEEGESHDSQSDSDDLYLFKISKAEDTLDLCLNGFTLSMVIDSGAHHNTLSVQDFKRLQKARPEVSLQPASTKLYPYASKQALTLLGKCTLEVEVPNTPRRVSASFFVVPQAQASLLSSRTSKELGLLRVGIDANILSCSGTDIWSSLRTKHPQVFSGLGKLKNYQLRLQIDPNVTPVIQPVRRIPYNRRRRVIEKLKELVDLDVIERVTEPAHWVNPLVTVEKRPENSHKCGDVRICVDMRRANVAIVRERHPVPTIDETIQEMAGGKYFSKIDLNMAYHQVELHPDSREITTFAAPGGLYRYKRLLFGVNMASEKFQQIISQVIKDCPGAYNMSDDIVVVGSTEAEHDTRLATVVQRLAERGLTVNEKKCQIKLTSIKYMGHVLSQDGLKVSNDKVKAIAHAPPPTDASQMRSFLGLAQFCAKFVPQFATITAPLWELTKQDAEWKWEEEEQHAFEQVKDALVMAPVMAYYSVGRPTRITCDASPIGVGAILEQQQTDGVWKPVYYASRKLTPTETRYSQFEREALGVFWACRKFSLYLIGCEFKILTDHKALVKVLSPNSLPPSARVERWLLYLQQFTYQVVHIPGKTNKADPLSRQPAGHCDKAEERETDEYIYSVIKDSVPYALTPREIEQVSKNDPNISKLRQAIQKNDWTYFKGTAFQAVKDELWTAGQLVMRGKRIVVPEALQERMLELGHEGHQGIVRTKNRLRTKVWWPEIDKMVERKVKQCYLCQVIGKNAPPEELERTPLPDQPWTYLAVDLLSISEGNYLLAVIDYYSRWPEVAYMKVTNATNVINALEMMFQTHGYPKYLRSDNGQPFASREFHDYLDAHGIMQLKGVPYWPQSNGEVERLNRTILKSVKIAKIEQKDWKVTLKSFLFHYRTTPHTVTGVSPAKLLMNRELRDKLPSFTGMPADNEEPHAAASEEIHDKDALQKLKRNIAADQRRGAKDQEIKPGDTVLCKNLHKSSKLDPNFESQPYEVVNKQGNAVTIQQPNSPPKMRNAAHVKKFTGDVSLSTPSVPGPVPSAESVSVSAPAPTLSPSSTGREPMAAVPSPDVPVKTARVRTPPAWQKDYVLTRAIT